MAVHTITADEVLTRLGEFDAIVDARSPAEHAEDRLPGAVSRWMARALSSEALRGIASHPSSRV